MTRRKPGFNGGRRLESRRSRCQQDRDRPSNVDNNRNGCFTVYIERHWHSWIPVSVPAVQERLRLDQAIGASEGNGKKENAAQNNSF